MSINRRLRALALKELQSRPQRNITYRVLDAKVEDERIVLLEVEKHLNDKVVVLDAREYGRDITMERKEENTNIKLSMDYLSTDQLKELLVASKGYLGH